MITAILIAFGLMIFGAALAGAVWLVSHFKRSAQAKKIAREETTAKGPSFHWSYVALPVAFLVLSILLVAYFYHQLPNEVALHFELDGTPDRWLDREIATVWLLMPQLLLALVAETAAWGITKMRILSRPTTSTGVKPERIILFMGNAVALPQLILFFTMLDIFSYNSYQRHIMPMWIFFLIILGLATIALFVLLTITILKAKQQLTSQPSHKTKEQK